jgi:purine-binding chemotaxis protein CheW
MRPLPLEALKEMPSFVEGLSIVRGAPVPVVDLARLMGHESKARRTRFVVVRVHQRYVALAVDRVIGVGAIPLGATALPSLLGEANAELIAAVGSLDARLLVVLKSGLILPEAAWQAFEARGGEG